MSANPNSDAELQALLSSLWQRHLPSVRERLLLLDHAAQDAARHQLTDPQREEALSIAHKLAGTLGMFGYRLAGSIASDMEQALKEGTPEQLKTLTKLMQRLGKELAPYLT